MPFYPFLGEGSPTKLDYKMGMGQNETIRGPQAFVFVSIYQSSLLDTYF